MTPSIPPHGSPHSTRRPSTSSRTELAAGIAAPAWTLPRATRSLDGPEGFPVLRAPRPEDSAGGARTTLIRALRALDRIHRRSIAGLLRQAAEIVTRRSIDVPPTSGFPLAPMAASVWLERCREVLALARADGWEPVGSTLLSRLIDRGPSAWPSPVRLSRAARIVEDGAFARLVVGYAHLWQGDALVACRVFGELLRQATPSRHRSRILEGLALAQAALGQERQALGTIEGAAEDPQREVSALAQGLSLALILGDTARIRHAAARLDMLVDPGSPDFAAVVGRLRKRRRSPSAAESKAQGAAAAAVGRSPSSPGTRVRLTEPLVELARESRSPSGRVARAMI